MPGPIITASDAKKAYKNKGVKSEGSNVSLKNSSGKRVKVPGTRKYITVETVTSAFIQKRQIRKEYLEDQHRKIK
jgi:hypothetical protein